MLTRSAARWGVFWKHRLSPIGPHDQLIDKSCGRLTATLRSMSSTETLRTSDARTEVIDRKSPADVIKQKEQELQKIGPSGYSRWLVYQLFSLPIWVMTAASLAVKYITRPGELFKQPDPTVFKLTPPFPLHEEFITVNGIKLHAVSPGRQPTKPLMLFLHGFPECWYSWRHQMAAFKNDYDVVAIDMRGYNTSDKPQGVQNYLLQQLAADVKEAVAALGHKSCTLVAHDWGGGVAWATAGLYGKELVNQLIVMALPHLGVSNTNITSKQYKRSSYMLLFQARGLAELVIGKENAAGLDDTFRAPPVGCKNPAALTAADTDWFRASACQPGALTAMLNYYRGLLHWQVFAKTDDPVWRALRKKLDMPTLVLHGEDDVALGVELLDGIEAAVPQSTVKVLKNCSHWVQQDYPQQVNEIMEDWLQAQSQG